MRHLNTILLAQGHKLSNNNKYEPQSFNAKIDVVCERIRICSVTNDIREGICQRVEKSLQNCYLWSENKIQWTIESEIYEDDKSLWTVFAGLLVSVVLAIWYPAGGAIIFSIVRQPLSLSRTNYSAQLFHKSKSL